MGCVVGVEGRMANLESINPVGDLAGLGDLSTKIPCDSISLVACFLGVLGLSQMRVASKAHTVAFSPDCFVARSHEPNEQFRKAKRELFGVLTDEFEELELGDEEDFGCAMSLAKGTLTLSATALDDAFLALRRKPHEAVASHTCRLQKLFQDAFQFFGSQQEMSSFRRASVFPRLG